MVIYYWHLSFEVGGEETESSMSPPPPTPKSEKKSKTQRQNNKWAQGLLLPIKPRSTLRGSGRSLPAGTDGAL